MVVIAIDYGEKKIGLAVGNTETMTSSPISIVKKAKTGFNWDELKKRLWSGSLIELSLVNHLIWMVREAILWKK